METTEAREKEFRKDLGALLDRYGAELVARLDSDKGIYSAKTEIFMCSKWGDNGQTHDICEFDL